MNDFQELARIREVRTGWKEKFDEFYTFDLMEIRMKEPAGKTNLGLEFQGQKFLFFFGLYSIHHENKTFPRNNRS